MSKNDPKLDQFETVAIARFKSMQAALCELRPFVIAPRNLEAGKQMMAFGDLRPREILGNWLICAAYNDAAKEDIVCFTTDPNGGDGLLYHKRDMTAFPTEHVILFRLGETREGTAEARILETVRLKVDRGPAYGSGKTLVVFAYEPIGDWHPNRVAKALPNPLHFEDVWVVALGSADGGRYTYGVTQLDLTHGKCPVWKVEILEDWCRWQVTRIQ